MSDDYGYINARIRAMKSFLLKKDDYLLALRSRTEGEFVSFLSSLPSYSNDLRGVLMRQPQKTAAEEALKLNLCRIFRKILNFCEGEPKRLILILLKAWDVHNLKTIIRGILSRQERGRVIQALLPAGKWDLEFLSKLAESRDLDSLAKSLVAYADNDKLEKGFARLLSGYSLDSPLGLLEANLQETYFENVQDSLNQKDSNAKIVLEYLSLQRSSGIFLKGLMKAKAKEESLRLFERSPYPWLAKEGLELYKRTQRLSTLERLFKNKLLLFCYGLYTRGDPLSIGIPLAFVNFKENEVNNLRLIGKAIAFEMPEDLIREGLIYAG